MMTDPIYCQKAMKKIDIYSKNGFIQGRDIIYTFESEKKQSKHNERGKSHQSNI